METTALNPGADSLDADDDRTRNIQAIAALMAHKDGVIAPQESIFVFDNSDTFQKKLVSDKMKPYKDMPNYISTIQFKASSADNLKMKNWVSLVGGASADCKTLKWKKKK